MKSNLLYSLLAFILVSFAIGCGGSKKVDEAVDDIAEVDVDYQNRDSTLYGICGRATTMNRMQLITDTGDTLMLSLTEAQEAGKMFGGMKVGDRMGVVANIDSTSALIVINLSAMMGDWVMEDAIDGGDEVGISIKDGGVAESINHTLVQYKSWRILNGQLEIVNTRDDGGDFEERGCYDILFIGPDSLAFKDSEDKYEYSRQKPKEDFDPGFELEESSFEDFVF